jgi:hypothetical protein
LQRSDLSTQLRGVFGLPDLLAVKNVCQLDSYHVTDGRVVMLTLDAVAISRLLEAGSGLKGSTGESGVWADAAARELALYIDGEDPWWEACSNIAEAGLRLDEVANQALTGPVAFEVF